MERFLQAIRRHRLDRMGAAYAVVAWAVVQGASIALPAFDAPAWAMRWTIVVAILGFPVALALAWHFSRDGQVAARQGWRRWVVPGVLAAVLVVSSVQLAFYWSRDPAPVPAPKPMVASIAVLPFANLSGDPAKRYFSDGIADQLITELSRRRNLRVAARTSSFALAGGNADIRTIARALGVRAVVEGSVREDGNRVRIAAELINAADGFPIWSESYDRDLTNILKLQDDIARAISRALSRTLTGSEGDDTPAKAQPTIDPEAYRDYLQGQFYFAQRSEDGIRRAIALFEQVTRRAPLYADGFAALGAAHAALALNFVQPNEIAPGTVAIARALALDPKNRIALMGRSTVEIVEWKWRAAADDLLKVEAANPGGPGIWHNQGVFLSYMGLASLALPTIERAVRQDPLSYIDRYNLALFLMNQGRLKDAAKVAREGLAIQPGNFEGQSLLCQVEAAQRDLDAARRVHMQLASSSNPEAALPALACAYHIATADGDRATVLAITESAAKGFPGNGVAANDVAIGYARAGNYDKALGWFETAYQLREAQVCAVQYSNPEIKAFYADRRWRTFRDKPEFRDWEAARAEIAKRFQLGE
ncbi:MAG TPA: hypothetical protein VG889_12520 [Rhizomicrobium sp.]|nr:hypothetical protein [Rhizomicrobium sp.]